MHKCYDTTQSLSLLARTVQAHSADRQALHRASTTQQLLQLADRLSRASRIHNREDDQGSSPGPTIATERPESIATVLGLSLHCKMKTE